LIGQARATPVVMYACPVDPTYGSGTWTFNGVTYGLTSYGLNFLAFEGEYNTIAVNNNIPNTAIVRTMSAAFADGASNTIVLTEKAARCNINLLGDGNNSGSFWAWNAASFIDTEGISQAPWLAVGSRTPASVSIGGYVLPPSSDLTRHQSCLTVGFMFKDKKKSTECGEPASPHTGGINILLADGSVRSVSPDITWQLWWALFTPASGETVGDY
jgi:prepilin-type processing-associated H-X9-DG protein